MADYEPTHNNLNMDDEAETTEETSEEMAPMDQFFYHQRRALEETRKALETLMPPGFKDHSTEASREFAKGFRVLVDAAIDELKKVSEKEENRAEDSDDNEGPSTTGKTKVKVQVD